MKRHTPKKSETRKGARKSKQDRPMEFGRGWQELEEQHDRIKSDWGSLAAMLGISAQDRLE